MNKKNIRSEYIKKLMEDKESISTQLEETTKDTLKEILGESVNKELRNILNESDEDDFEEEEVKTEEPDVEETSVDAEMEDINADVESSEDTDNEDVWSGLESVKGEDGEYDLTGMDKDEVIKVLKVMKPEDGVRVVKNDNGSLTLTDDETDKEYIIDIDENFCDDETEIEVEVDDFDGIEESVNYIKTDYQKKTAMTTPSNNEPSKNTYSMDSGVPTDTSRPWGKKGDNTPYDEIITEVEIDVDCDGDDCQEIEESSSVGFPERNNTRIDNVDVQSNHPGRNMPKRKTKTSDSPYQPSKTDESLKLENIKRKANAIFKENSELKDVLAQLKGKLEESIVINASLGKIIQLVTENTTSRDEKLDIVNRFNNVKTIQESRELYTTISKELKGVKNTTKAQVNESMDKQIAEGKNNNIIETSIYKSTDLSNTLNLMDRMMNL